VKLGPLSAVVLSTGLIALLMSAAMSFVLTAVNLGIGPDFLTSWWRSFVFAWAVAWPLALGIIPAVRRLLSHWTGAR
jgi:hypothetical protein